MFWEQKITKLQIYKSDFHNNHSNSNLQFLSNITINKTKVLLTQAYVILADFGYTVWLPFVSQLFIDFSVLLSIFRIKKKRKNNLLK
jgi:hypothetical protein